MKLEYDRNRKKVMQVITVKDIMAIYKVSQATVYNWIYEGMPRYKIGRNVRFDQLEVDDWVRNKKGVKS